MIKKLISILIILSCLSSCLSIMNDVKKSWNKDFHRGINLANALEASNEGEWG